MKHLAIDGLGRVNLLVGTNNCGKTSILEAVLLLESAGDPFRIWNICYRRGERSYRMQNPQNSSTDQSTPQPPTIVTEADIQHLFNGHEVHAGSTFSIAAKGDSARRLLQFDVRDIPPTEKMEPGDIDEDNPAPRLALYASGDPPPSIAPRLILSKSGSVRIERLIGNQARTERPIQFISTESSSAEELTAAWGRVVLKPEEELVYQALRSIDKSIERITLLARNPPYYFGAAGRGGFVVKLKSSEEPVPIGSMGDGIWRMFALAMAIAQAKGGTLLVDEIDTGLHYTVMSSMWKLVYDAARKFNVQVFATSHSQDCIWSLAQLAQRSEAEHPITVQRIEAGKRSSVPYTGQEIAIAADREIEVR